MKQLSQTPEATAAILGTSLAKAQERVAVHFRRREARPRCGPPHGVGNVGAEKTVSVSPQSGGQGAG